MGKIISNKGLNLNSINKFYYGLDTECDENTFIYGINKLSKISNSYYNQRGLEYFSTKKNTLLWNII